MFEAVLTIVGVVAFAAPPALLVAAFIWVQRAGRTVSKARRRAFIGGLLLSTLAYPSHFLLRWYVHRSHLGYWAEVDTVVGVGGLMFLAAITGLVAGCFGRGYGRITTCIASFLIAMLWWLTGVATL